MRKLNRRGVSAPADWPTKVRGALPANYLAEAARYEAQPLSSDDRTNGFKKFAPHAMPRNGRGDPVFPSLWSSVSEIKTTLDKMTKGRCAYCEQLINARRSGQVEHFKPKSLFPSLCYDMNNYFLACNGCNGAKSNKWPQSGSYIRPDVGRPGRKLVFSENGRVVPANAARKDVVVTIQDFALGRGGLVRARKVAIKGYLDATRFIFGSSLPKSEKRRFVRMQLRSLSREGVPYSMAIRQSLKAEWENQFPGEPV